MHFIFFTSLHLGMSVPHPVEEEEREKETCQPPLGGRGFGPMPITLNTPLLPIKKVERGQYLTTAGSVGSQRTNDIHPVIPNPYTLLSLLQPKKISYILDLKGFHWLSSQSTSLLSSG